MSNSLIERMTEAAANVRAMSERLKAYQVAMENACLIYAVPFGRDQPEKTLAELTRAIVEETAATTRAVMSQ